MRLRAMLERARREGEDRSAPGRQIALVTLDGACEYAIRLCAHHRGVAIKPRTSFHDAIERLGEDVPRWTKTGIRGVLELHEARNQAQHLGLLPDPSLISGWTVDAQAFIEELIQEALDVRLDDVLLADAVRDENIRGLLSEAERQLNRGEYRAAFRYADEALRQTRLRWLQQRGVAGQAESDLRYGSTPVNLPRPGDPADQLEMQVFASDVSRYTQFLTTRHHLESGGPELDEVEVRSAVTFVLDWVLQWEVFDAGYPSERYAEYWSSVSTPQLDDGGPPRIAWHIGTYRIEGGAGREDEYELLLQLANLPADQGGYWGIDFPAALNDAEGEFAESPQVAFLAIDPRGTLRVRVPASADPDGLARVIRRATEIATERYERRDQDMQSWLVEAAGLRDRYTDVVRGVNDDEDVYGDVDVTPELTSDGVRFMVSLEVVSGAPFELNLASGIFSGQGGYLAGASHQAGRVVFNAFPLEEGALDQLRKAIRDSELEIRRYRAIAARVERDRRHFSSQIEELLGAVPRERFESAPTEDYEGD